MPELVSSEGALAAEVVSAPFQDREREVVARLALGRQERQVPLGQLVLECLGGGGHHRRSAGLDHRQQVREGLPRAGAGLDDEMAILLDRSVHVLCHLELPGPVLTAAGQGPREVVQQASRVSLDGHERDRSAGQLARGSLRREFVPDRLLPVNANFQQNLRVRHRGPQRGRNGPCDRVPVPANMVARSVGSRRPGCRFGLTLLSPRFKFVRGERGKTKCLKAP